MSFLWDDIKKEFPIFSNNEKLIYFDNASTVHKPVSVISSMNEYLSESYANIHRGVYSLAEKSEELYLWSKKKISNFINADFREIIYTYNATYASNLLAQSLVQTYNIWSWDVVLIGIRDHHATIVPRQILSKQYWFDIKFILLDKNTWDVDWNSLENLIEQHSPKALVCSHVSNVTWIVYDIKRISEIILWYWKEIFFVVDWSQAIPHMKVDVKDLCCDAYFFTWHKMMWPTGIWVLWIEKNIVRKLMTTFWWGWIIESVTTETCSLLRTSDKFEPWTPNLIGAVWLWAACDFYNDYAIYDNITTHESDIYEYIVKWISKIQKIDLLLWSSIKNCWIVSLVVKNPLEFSEYLSDNNICVRAGGHCAHPLLHYLWQDKWVVRISPFIYNTLNDVEFMLDVISSYKW